MIPKRNRRSPTNFSLRFGATPVSADSELKHAAPAIPLAAAIVPCKIVLRVISFDILLPLIPCLNCSNFHIFESNATVVTLDGDVALA